MRNIRCWLVALTCLWTFGACTDDAPKGHDDVQSQVAKLCKDGGAAFNATTSECLCPAAQAWDGTHCAEVAAKPAAAPAELVPAPKAAEAPQPPASAGEDDAKLVQACAKAKAKWLPEEHYCLCPGGKALVGSRCLKLAGRMIDDVCERAVHKGVWRDGLCECADGLIFSPPRGGCVQPQLAEPTTLAYSCESTLNNGHWEAAAVRCRCPKGRVWVDELCQVQQLLPSADVCEGGFNKGKWDGENKRCNCPAGLLWLNQSCQPPTALPIKKVCESEWNGGVWNAARRSCRCPDGGRWNQSTFQCTHSAGKAKAKAKKKCP